MNTSPVNPARREFLVSTAAIGGGLALGFHLPRLAEAAAPASAEVNAWVLIQPDDAVVIRVARSEMGQGSSTGLPMLIAEELGCDWRKVRMEFASVNEHLRRNRVFVTMATGGSRAIRDSQEYLRKAGATAREMLVAAAAQRLDVPVAECSVADGVISHKKSRRSVRFGAVAHAAAKLEPPKTVSLKDPKDWTLVGSSPPRFDIPDKVAGQPVFGIDARPAGTLYAAIAQCPVFGGKVKSLVADKAAGMRGVKRVLDLGDAVAVVADNWWRADRALKAVAIDWDVGDNAKVSSDSIRDFLRGGLDDQGAPVVRNDGDVDKAFAGAAKVVEAEYYAPFLNHATMEPQTATALVRGDKVEVWASTQNGEGVAAAAAEVAGVPVTNVEVYRMQLGGGFGRRGAFHDAPRQAVRIAKAMAGAPVKLVWSREQDMQHGFYRPVSMARLKGALDAQGNLVAWQVRLADQSILTKVRPEEVKNGVDPIAVRVFSDAPYVVPNYRLAYAMRNTHVPVGFWRAVAHSNNPFHRECFMDELAHAAGKDPYEFRRALLGKATKDLGVLDAAAKAADWGKPLPAGRHRGIAVQDAYGSYAAAVIEVSVSDQGELKIHRVVVAVDPGHVVHKDAAIAQIQGNVAFGLSAALWGENLVKDGRIAEGNFDDYRIMRLPEMPEVLPVLVPSGGFWGGMGEPPLSPLAPALCNAIFAATGKRIRSLPLKNHDLRRA